jgi:hypothetical protein
MVPFIINDILKNVLFQLADGIKTASAIITS